jgi:hypothetical protein
MAHGTKTLSDLPGNWYSGLDPDDFVQLTLEDKQIVAAGYLNTSYTRTDEIEAGYRTRVGEFQAGQREAEQRIAQSTIHEQRHPGGYIHIININRERKTFFEKAERSAFLCREVLIDQYIRYKRKQRGFIPSLVRIIFGRNDD